MLAEPRLAPLAYIRTPGHDLVELRQGAARLDGVAAAQRDAGSVRDEPHGPHAPRGNLHRYEPARDYTGRRRYPRAAREARQGGPRARRGAPARAAHGGPHEEPTAPREPLHASEKARRHGAADGQTTRVEAQHADAQVNERH